MPHGRGQVQYLELGLRRDGTIVGLRCRIVGDAGAYAGFGGMLAFGPTRMMSQGVYRIPKIGYDVRGRAHQPRADGRVPRRGPARSGGDARAHHRHGRGRARHRPGRDPAAQLPAARRVPVHDRHRRHLRHRRLRRRAHRGAAHRRLRRAARRAGGAARARRRQAARHRRLRVRRDHRGRHGAASTPRSRCTPTAARPSRRARRRTVRVTPPRTRSSSPASSASRSSSIEFVQSDTALVPRGGGTGGSRSLQIGGQRGARSVARRARPARAASRPSCSKPRPTTSSLTDDGTLGVAGVPAQGDHVGRDRDQGERRRPPARGRARLRAVGCVVPVRRARRRWSRSTPRPAGSSRSATSRSTTAVASSTRCSSTARCTAGWRRASRRRCGRRWSTTTTATRSRRRWPSTPSRARPSSRRSRSRTPRRRRR